MLVLLFLIVGIVVPSIQNVRTIQKLKSIDKIDVSLEPDFLLSSLPTNWQTWLYDTLGEDRLIPFSVVTAIFCRDSSISDKDLAIVSTLDHLNELDLEGTQISDTGLIQLK